MVSLKCGGAMPSYDFVILLDPGRGSLYASRDLTACITAERPTTEVVGYWVIFAFSNVIAGEHHKRQRKVVQPVFAVPQLKRLVPKFYEVAHRLCDVIAQGVAEEQKETSSSVLDMSLWMSRVALESVGQTVLGYSFDPLDSPSNNPYSKAVRELIPALFSVSLIRQFAPFIARLGSPSFRRKLVELMPNATIQKIKNMSDVMYDTARDILYTKKESITEFSSESGEGQPKDVVSVLSHEGEREAV
ncbi:hypothetical protein EWM64_g746 [Hericium alpestre]|uniref:Cytochrome P450 n=1 Tax=Hericium alpestre TaxID=135208 RepID=A0A4Z0AAB1_9AGAM|nr:hypothetical protein EWM64_g746 [Hericium alpestre]